MRKQLIPFLGLVAMMAASCSGSGSDDNYFKEVAEATVVPIRTDGSVGYINDKGEAICGGYDHGGYFHSGLALVKEPSDLPKGLPDVDSLNRPIERYYYINKEGKRAFEGNYLTATDFNEGLAWVSHLDSCLMAIDTNGRVKLRLPEAYHVSYFRWGYSVFSTIDNNLGVVNTKGEVTYLPDSTKQFWVRPDDVFFAKNKGGTNSLYKLKKGELTKMEVSDRHNLVEYSSQLKLAIVEQGDKYGIADLEGNLVVNPHYKALQFDGELIAFMNEKKKIGWIDAKGNEVIPAKYTAMAEPFCIGYEIPTDYAVVSTTGSKFQVINRKGETVIGPKYKKIQHLTETLFAVQTDAGYGIADARTGEVTVKPEFEDLDAISFKIFLATSGDDKWGVIDMAGHYMGDMDYNPLSHSYSDSPRAVSGRVDVNGMINKIVDLVKKVEKYLSNAGTLGEIMTDYSLSESSLDYSNYLQIFYHNLYAGQVVEALSAEFDHQIKYRQSTGYWSSRTTTKVDKNARPVLFEIFVQMPNAQLRQVVAELESKYKYKVTDSDTNPRSGLETDNYFNIVVKKGEPITITPPYMVMDYMTDEDYEGA